MVKGMNNQKFKLVPSDWATLRQVAEPVKDFEVEALNGQLYWLRKLLNHLKGAGLAAPQLGDSRRWFIWSRGLVINPEILNHGLGSQKAMERCLSFPSIESPRERWLSLEVRYVDENNQLKLMTLTEPESRVFQHELDHLNGICIDQPQTPLQ